MYGISVSGIKGSQKHLDVTSNNIANTNTYGFKKSRAEFADMYANSVYSNGKTSTGLGVQNSVVSQQFVQGSLSGDTGNPLDMAIQGNGFFVLGDGTSLSHTYTRNGAFQLNNEGYIVTATGEYLQGWDVAADGSAATKDLNSAHNILIPSGSDSPNPSSSASIGLTFSKSAKSISTVTPTTDSFTGQAWANDIAGTAAYGVPRDAQGAQIAPADANAGYTQADRAGAAYLQYYTNFDPKDSSTYSNSTSQTVYDSLGGSHVLTYYFLNMGPESAETGANTVWTAIPYLDGQPIDVQQVAGEQGTIISVPSSSTSSAKGSNFFGFRMVFDSNGDLVGSTEGSKTTIPANITFVNGDRVAAPAGSDGRNTLFGVIGEANTGSLTVVDGTFEQDDGQGNISAGGAYGLIAGAQGGSLHSAMGTGVDINQSLNLSMSANMFDSTNFEVSVAPVTDGYATGYLTGVSVSDDGIILAQFSNGQKVNVAKLALADFTNQQGLTKVGNTQWKESIDSGAAIAREANSGSAGSIIGSNLELSNVDLTSELVELITAQRNYQANAQSLQTQNTVMDSILNIR